MRLWHLEPSPTNTPNTMIACIHKDCPMNGLFHTGSDRQDEKQLQRRQDEEEIRQGITNPEEMRRRNSYFAVDSTIDWEKAYF